ncbi:transporter associated domain-containing protein, partial [Burkholderia sp. SIMBA_013]
LAYQPGKLLVRGDTPLFKVERLLGVDLDHIEAETLAGLIYDTLAMQSLDEPITEYGLVAGKIEKAPDNSWVRFYLRPEAR